VPKQPAKAAKFLKTTAWKLRAQNRRNLDHAAFSSIID
jgi:hypothetical protein